MVDGVSKHALLVELAVGASILGLSLNSSFPPRAYHLVPSVTANQELTYLDCKLLTVLIKK